MKNLFPPVFLKYTTCIITDNVSKIGISAIKISTSGIFKYKAILEITPPKNNEPVSPIKILAGCKLNIKNPNTAPITTLPKITTSEVPFIIAIAVKHAIIIHDTDDDNPSIPSVKLIAFVVASITKIANGIYKYTDKFINVLNIGKYVCVPI